MSIISYIRSIFCTNWLLANRVSVTKKFELLAIRELKVYGHVLVSKSGLNERDIKCCSIASKQENHSDLGNSKHACSESASSQNTSITMTKRCYMEGFLSHSVRRIR